MIEVATPSDKVLDGALVMRTKRNRKARLTAGFRVWARYLLDEVGVEGDLGGFEEL